jgi:apolipoprotein N-acyltransferase
LTTGAGPAENLTADPIVRLSRRLAGLSGWRRYLLAAALGAVAAAALPPINLLPLLPIAFTGLVWLIDGGGPRGAFVAGWWFGLGHFAVGLYWIGHAFLVDAARFGWMMPLGVLGLSAYLAFFPALAAFAARLAPGPGLGRVIFLATAWASAEWLRGQLLTGFPWNLIGYVWTLSDAMIQVTAVTGVYGLGLVTVLAAAMPAVLARSNPGAARRWLPLAAVAALLAAVWSGGAWRLSTAEIREVPDVRLRIVQANIAQRDKWRAALRDANLQRYMQLSSGPGAASITHLIWPETAVPFFLADDPERRRVLGGLLPPEGLLLTGTVRRTPPLERPIRLWNSLHAVDSRGDVVATYDKVHLVPFGEYVPARPLLDRIGISKLTHGPIDFAPGAGRRNLDLPGLPPFSPLICYEVIFPGAVTPPKERPAWLLNLTNDAWFGISPGPYQHLAMARVRAVEEGLPLVRAAGTGISAVVDPYGRVIGSLGLDQSGVLDSTLPSALARPPLYARIGDIPALVLILIGFVTGWLLGSRESIAI